MNENIGGFVNNGKQFLRVIDIISRYILLFSISIHPIFLAVIRFVCSGIFCSCYYNHQRSLYCCDFGVQTIIRFHDYPFHFWCNDLMTHPLRQQSTHTKCVFLFCCIGNYITVKHNFLDTSSSYIYIYEQHEHIINHSRHKANTLAIINDIQLTHKYMDIK